MSRVQRFGVPLLAVVILAASSLPLFAAQATSEARGTVTAVTDSSLKVKAGTQEMTFAVDPKTTVTAEGAGRQTRDAKATGAAGIKLTGIIKTGEAVIVTYTEAAGTMRATAIRAVSTPGPGGGSVATSSPTSRTANGTVKSVSAGSLVITSSAKDMTFAVTPDTSVQGRGVGTASAAAGGRIAITSVVGVGDTVSVSYQDAGTTMRATEVRVTAKAAK